MPTSRSALSGSTTIATPTTTSAAPRATRQSGAARLPRGQLPATPERRDEVRERRLRGDGGGDDGRERGDEQQQAAEVAEERVPHRAGRPPVDLLVARQPLDGHPAAGQQQDRRERQARDGEARAPGPRGASRAPARWRPRPSRARRRSAASESTRRRCAISAAVSVTELTAVSRRRDVGLDAVHAADRQVPERRLHEHAHVAQVEPQRASRRPRAARRARAGRRPRTARRTAASR